VGEASKLKIVAGPEAPVPWARANFYQSDVVDSPSAQMVFSDDVTERRVILTFIGRHQAR
jgi:hypothetical protein